MPILDLTSEELSFLRDAVLAIPVRGTVEDVINGKMALTEMAASVYDKLNGVKTLVHEPEPDETTTL